LHSHSFAEPLSGVCTTCVLFFSDNRWPSDQDRTSRWKNHPAEGWVFCIAVIPKASTCSLSACLYAYHSYSCACLPLLVLFSFGVLPHRCPFPKLGLFTQTYCLGLIVLRINMTRQTNRLGDISRCRVFRGSPLMVPIRIAHMSIEYQNYLRDKGYQ